MSKPVKKLIIVTAIALMAGASVYAATGAGEKGDIGESRARQIALAEVAGSTDGDITKFRKGMDDNRLEYDIEIIYGGYEYDFEISAADGTVFDRSKDEADSYGSNSAAAGGENVEASCNGHGNSAVPAAAVTDSAGLDRSFICRHRC